MNIISISENGERAGWRSRNKCARRAIAVHVSTFNLRIEQTFLKIVGRLKIASSLLLSFLTDCHSSAQLAATFGLQFECFKVPRGMGPSL